MSTKFDEDEERKKLQEAIDFFSELFGKHVSVDEAKSLERKVATRIRHMPPPVRGDCSCCFKPSVGHFLAYQYKDRTVHQCFICMVCLTICPPQEPCKIENWTSGLKMLSNEQEDI